MTPKLKSLRDELADVNWIQFNLDNRDRHFKSIYRDGFDSCAAILLPEIEKLRAALINASPIGHSEECENMPLEAGPRYCLLCEINKALKELEAFMGETR